MYEFSESPCQPSNHSAFFSVPDRPTIENWKLGRPGNETIASYQALMMRRTGNEASVHIELVESGTCNAEQNYVIQSTNTRLSSADGTLEHCPKTLPMNTVPHWLNPWHITLLTKTHMFMWKHTFIVLSHFNLLGPGMTYSKVFAGGASTTPTAL